MPALLGGGDFSLVPVQNQANHCCRWSKLIWFDFSLKLSRQSHSLFYQRRVPRPQPSCLQLVICSLRALPALHPADGSELRGLSYSLSKYPETRLTCKLKGPLRYILTHPLSNSQNNIRQKTLCNIHSDPSLLQGLRLPSFTDMTIMITKKVTKKKWRKHTFFKKPQHQQGKNSKSPIT